MSRIIFSLICVNFIFFVKKIKFLISYIALNLQLFFHFILFIYRYINLSVSLDHSIFKNKKTNITLYGIYKCLSLSIKKKIAGNYIFIVAFVQNSEWTEAWSGAEYSPREADCRNKTICSFKRTIRLPEESIQSSRF